MSSRKNRKQEELNSQLTSKRIRLGFTMVNPKGIPVPAAKPSSIIQLSPIVQPIAMTPYSTQQQPLATASDIDDDF